MTRPPIRGQVDQAEAPAQYADQRRFFAQLGALDVRITHHLGRLETRVVENFAAEELLHYLNPLPVLVLTRMTAQIERIAG